MRWYEVLLTRDAERDLEEIHDYIAEQHSPGAADHVLDRVGKAVVSLAAFPERGFFPRELLALGIRNYRQVFFQPYRLICRTIGTRVLVYLIVDGRRDMQALLARRLLEG